jgi:hypothetical protein
LFNDKYKKTIENKQLSLLSLYTHEHEYIYTGNCT